MKRIFALLLALVMCLSLAACGGKDDGKTPSGNNDPQQSSQQQEQQPSNTPDPGTSEPGESTSNDSPGKEWPVASLAEWAGSGQIVDAMERESFYEDGRIQYMIYIDTATLDEFTAYISTLKEAGFTYGEVSGKSSTEPEAGYSESETLYDWGGNNESQQYVKITLMKESTEGFTEDFDTYEYQVCIEFYTP